ncbi:MAG TPA: PQQ-binding-like beta-propeller repeat protein [Verrucomicrobiae bacterium]|nr:PQQ-binding-like beta-propeller repeat protein [Verrucomicrobiae bacterium]
MDESIIFGSWDKHVYAIRPDGSLKWKFKTEGPISSSAVILNDGTICVGSHDGKFYGLAPSGEKLWDFPTGGPVISSPALSGDVHLVVTSASGFLYKLEPSGKLVWKLHTGGVTAASPVIGSDGTIYLGVNNSVWALHPGGKRKWSVPMVHPMRAELAILKGDIVVVSYFQGPLHLFDAQMAKVATFPLWGEGDSAPVLGSNGNILAFKMDALVSLGGSFELCDSPWPRPRGDRRNTGRARTVSPSQ